MWETCTVRMEGRRCVIYGRGERDRDVDCYRDLGRLASLLPARSPGSVDTRHFSLARSRPEANDQALEGFLASVPLGPALGWGGIRLEHPFVVRADGNEILTQFEHAL